MAEDKYYANRGVERNKKPLQNIVYMIELSDLHRSKDTQEEKEKQYGKYKFKDLGYLVLNWQYEKDLNKTRSHWNWHGFITPEDLKKKLGDKQWAKFCQGKREFVIQRRVDGKNVKKKKKDANA